MPPRFELCAQEGTHILGPVSEPGPPPPAGQPSDEQSGSLPVAVVARQLGLAPATLRTWARRYGLGPGSHDAGAHRRYAPEDVARLEAVRRLTLQGLPPGEAARLVLGAPAARPAPQPARSGGAGDGALPRAGAERVVRGLGRAAVQLDSATVMAMVRGELAEHGVLHTWDHVLRPVLAAVGARWAQTGQGVEVEHLLSECLTAVLREAAQGAPAAVRPVLLASAPDEQHSLPLHALAAGLAERQVGSRVLGPAMPAVALEAAVRRTGAAALFLWSQLPGTGGEAAVHALPATRPPTAVVVGGPGWTGAELPERVGVARDLREAVELVRHAVAG